jgi:hypothetical protein
VAITSVGYDGSVTEVEWAGLAQFVGSAYAVGGLNDWRVETVAGQDRTVRILPGTGYGHGVADLSDANVTLQLPTIGSGTRWDLVVARRDWQPPGGTTTFTHVTGTATQQIPAGRKSGPGVEDDQPLALVQVTAGQTLPTGIVDLRVLPSKVLSVWSLLALPDATIGTVARVGPVEYIRGGSGWQRSPALASLVTLAGGWYQPASRGPVRVSKDGNGMCHLSGVAGNQFAYDAASGPYLILTLPTGFRPLFTEHYALALASDSRRVVEAEVRTNGQVLVVNSGGLVPVGRFHGFGGMSFYAGD